MKSFTLQRLTLTELKEQLKESYTELTDLDLSNLNLTNFDFSNITLENVTFENSILQNADFTDTFIVNVNFKNADLRGAMLPFTIDENTKFFTVQQRLSRLPIIIEICKNLKSPFGIGTIYDKLIEQGARGIYLPSRDRIDKCLVSLEKQHRIIRIEEGNGTKYSPRKYVWNDKKVT